MKFMGLSEELRNLNKFRLAWESSRETLPIHESPILSRGSILRKSIISRRCLMLGSLSKYRGRLLKSTRLELLTAWKGPRCAAQDFIKRKICRGVARIKFGLDRYIVLGNLDARRDWGHAEDFVESMWIMMQQETPSDYVVAMVESEIEQIRNYSPVIA